MLSRIVVEIIDSSLAASFGTALDVTARLSLLSLPGSPVSSSQVRLRSKTTPSSRGRLWLRGAGTAVSFALLVLPSVGTSFLSPMTFR